MQGRMWATKFLWLVRVVFIFKGSFWGTIVTKGLQVFLFKGSSEGSDFGAAKPQASTRFGNFERTASGLLPSLHGRYVA